MIELIHPLTGKPRLYLGPEAPIRARSGPVSAAVKREPAIPSQLSRDLGRILRPQAAYRWLLPQLAAITPQYIEMVLRGALAGSHVQSWELFDLMEDTWPRLPKNLNDLKRAAIALDWKLYPWQEEDTAPSESAKEKAKLISSAIWRMQPDPAADENAFAATLYDILDAWGKGLSVLEIDWHIRRAGQLGDITAPRATFWVHPTCYAWSQTGRLGLRTELGTLKQDGARWPYSTWQPTSFTPMPGMVDDFPPDKFLIGISKAKSGSPLGAALLRPLAWWWCSANFSADWLLNLAQVFGLPFRWANYDPSAPQATVDAICDMLENMGSSGWAAFPAGTVLDLKEPGKTGDMSPQGNLLDRADRNCDLLILGQTLTSDVGASGSRALGDVHQSVRGDVIQSAANFAAEVINRQLIPSILRLNYGDDEELPEFRPEPQKKEDQKANAERDQIVLNSGVLVPRDWFYKRHDIPIPQEGEETIGGKPQTPPNGSANPLNQQSNNPPAGHATKAKSAAAPDPNETFSNAALAQFAKAIAEDLQPLRARLAAILQIQDPELLQTKLSAFLADTAKLAADMGRDPAAAHSMQDILTSALANGIASGKTNQPTNI